jgi:predicted nucleotidyltransferase
MEAIMVSGKTATAGRKKNITLSTAGKRAAPFAGKIPFIRSLILNSVEPGTIKKIYLFGSYAYGKPMKKSDIDLCVIIKNSLVKSRADINLKIALNLFDNKIIPADILVYTEKQFNSFTNPNGVENTILSRGKLIYE